MMTSLREETQPVRYSVLCVFATPKDLPKTPYDSIIIMQVGRQHVGYLRKNHLEE